MGSHPLVDGGARFCAVDACYCGNKDACFPVATAAACCPSQPVCASDAGAQCQGTHPLVDGGARFCAIGACYCGNNDACFPVATAAACCASQPVCASDAGAQCQGTHPLLDAGARFCAPGSCRCVNTDACFPMTDIDRCCQGMRTCF
jgi:hypothetical protein